MKADYAWVKDKRVIALGFSCVAAGFLIGMLVFGQPWHLPPDWGDIPTWIAAVAAIGAGVIAYRVYAESVEERRSAQASKIAAWYGYKTESVIDTSRVQPIHVEKPIWGAFLRNASDLPVYDVTVDFYSPDSDDSAHTIHKRTLPPSDAPIHVKIDNIALRLYSDDPKMDRYHRVEIEFTDTQGIRWHRDVKGRLKRKPR